MSNVKTPPRQPPGPPARPRRGRRQSGAHRCPDLRTLTANPPQLRVETPADAEMVWAPAMAPAGAGLRRERSLGLRPRISHPGTSSRSKAWPPLPPSFPQAPNSLGVAAGSRVCPERSGGTRPQEATLTRRPRAGQSGAEQDGPSAAPDCVAGAGVIDLRGAVRRRRAPVPGGRPQRRARWRARASGGAQRRRS